MSKIARPTTAEMRLFGDALWSEMVKWYAEYKSEYSGKSDEPLNSHHIFGKPTLAHRYSLANGVCLTAGEHKFIAHNPDRKAVWDEFLEKLFGGIGNLNEYIQLLRDIHGTNISSYIFFLVKVYAACEGIREFRSLPIWKHKKKPLETVIKYFEFEI